MLVDVITSVLLWFTVMGGIFVLLHWLGRLK
jgi:hypothetical protein